MSIENNPEQENTYNQVFGWLINILRSISHDEQLSHEELVQNVITAFSSEHDSELKTAVLNRLRSFTDWDDQYKSFILHILKHPQFLPLLKY